MKTLWIFRSAVLPLLAGCLLCQGVRASTVLPLQLEQNYTTYNLQSGRGVPLSSVANTPPGSDGRAPTGVNESGSLNPPTANQFSSGMAFGGGVHFLLDESLCFFQPVFRAFIL